MLERLTEAEVDSLLELIDELYCSALVLPVGMLFKKGEKRGVKFFFFSGSRMPAVPADWVGLHFCTVDGALVIPSIEGAQLIGDTANKFISLSYGEAEEVLAGRDVILKNPSSAGLYILKSGVDVLGVGRVEGGVLVSLTPKSRRTRRQYRRADAPV